MHINFNPCPAHYIEDLFAQFSGPSYERKGRGNWVRVNSKMSSDLDVDLTE